jgi:S1-C subfamily serine protease
MNNSARTIFAHLLTAASSLFLAYVLFQSRPAPAGPRALPAAGQAPAPPVGTPVPAAPAPAPIDPRAWELAQADELVNIHVYDTVNRSVVNITTSATVQGFFEQSTASGSGSGFVLDNRGYILTNYHVVEGADTVQVGLHDGSTHDADVVGTDPSTDVAVLRIEAAPELLFPVVLGDSTSLKVGQKILALGNPFGLERTLTTGIISSLERSIESTNGRTIKGIIQTDAAINPGNSGGPLLNARGEVIGMNTAIFSKVGQSAGISFAVPIAQIQRILRPLIEDGRIVRSDLGISRVYGLEEGLLIVELAEGGPAAEAGLRPVQIRYVRSGPFLRPRIDPSTADVILAIEGVRVRSVSELLTEVESHPPGKTVRVTVLRGNRTEEVEVTLGRSS